MQSDFYHVIVWEKGNKMSLVSTSLHLEFVITENVLAIGKQMSHFHHRIRRKLKHFERSTLIAICQPMLLIKTNLNWVHLIWNALSLTIERKKNIYFFSNKSFHLIMADIFFISNGSLYNHENFELHCMLQTVQHKVSFLYEKIEVNWDNLCDRIY